MNDERSTIWNLVSLHPLHGKVVIVHLVDKQLIRKLGTDFQECVYDRYQNEFYVDGRKLPFVELHVDRWKYKGD